MSSTRVIGSDFHVTYQSCKYSVPYRFVGKTVDLKITDSVIEIYCGHERISSHKRFPSYVRNRYDTYPEDIPERFQKTEWKERPAPERPTLPVRSVCMPAPEPH